MGKPHVRICEGLRARVLSLLDFLSTAAFQQAAVFVFRKILICTFAMMRICGYNGGRKEWRCCKCFAVKQRNEWLSCPLTRHG